MRSFVDQLDFKTSAGYLGDTRARAQMGARGRGPQALITDLGILRPDPATGEFILTELYPGVETGEVVAATGWALKISPAVARIDPPSPGELDALRDLHARTQSAHRTPPRLPFSP